MSDKREAFKRLSKPRIQKAIKSIQLVGNLSRSQYEYSTQEAHQLIADLDAEIDKLRKLYKIDQLRTNTSGDLKPDPDPEIEQASGESLSWASWALDRLLMGDPKAAKEMLIKAIKINRERIQS